MKWLPAAYIPRLSSPCSYCGIALSFAVPEESWSRPLVPLLCARRHDDTTKEPLNKGWHEENGHRKFVGARRGR